MITSAELGRQRFTDKSRIGAVIVVVAAHVTAILLIPSLGGPRHARERAGSEALVVYMLPVQQANPPPLETPLLPRERKTRVAQQAQPNAITLPDSEPPSPPAPDWALEREIAARRYLDSLQEEDRRAASMGKPGVEPRDPLVKPTTPDFGWSHSQVHRVEELEGGGTIVWINERCFIVITLLAMPMCGIGKIEARSDLFEHMDDAPTLGDWK